MMSMKHRIHKIHRKHNKKHTIHNPTSNICQQSIQSIKAITSNKILSSYTKYLSLTVNKFINNTNHKRILESIFTIKDKLINGKYKHKLQQYALYMKHLPMDFELDTTLKIPNFIELIQYLITIPTFNKYFSKDELDSLRNILSSHTAHQNTNQNKHQIYDYLHNNTIGSKIADIYYKEYYNFNMGGNMNDTLDSKFPSIKFHQLLINSFTSYKILEDIEQNMNSLSIGSLEYNKNNHNNKNKYDNLLYIFSNAKEEKDARYSSDRTNEFHQISKLGDKIIQRLLFFNEFLGTDKLPTKIIIFLTNQEKEIDDVLEHKAHFRSLNVNSAVTNGQDIIIYRKQELLKSVFHELIHFHQLDFRTIPPNSEKVIMDYLKKTHNIAENNEYLLYECITESLANILNNIYSTNTQNLKHFKNHFIDELLFSTFQVTKILRICKYTSWEEFALLESDSNLKPQHNPAKQFIQDSCVFSYYILKLYILLNINEYWNTILDSHLKFIPNEDNFKKLIEIFEKGRKNIYLTKMINSLLQGTLNTKHTNDKFHNKFHNKFHSKINKTLRMTCVE